LPVERGFEKDGLVLHPVAYPDSLEGVGFAARMKHQRERQDPGYLIVRYTPRDDEGESEPMLFQKAIMLLAVEVQKAAQQNRLLSDKPFDYVEIFLTTPKGSDWKLLARGIFSVDDLRAMNAAPSFEELENNQWIVLDRSFEDWDVKFLRSHAAAMTEKKGKDRHSR
jgi:hypothetical protein